MKYLIVLLLSSCASQPKIDYTVLYSDHYYEWGLAEVRATQLLKQNKYPMVPRGSFSPITF